MILFRDGYSGTLFAINHRLIRRVWSETTIKVDGSEETLSLLHTDGSHGKISVTCPLMELIKAIDHCNKTGEHADLTAWETK